MTSNSAQISY